MVKCEICQKEFKDRAGLTGHIRFSHPDSVLVSSAELLKAIKQVEKLLNSLIQALKLPVAELVDNPGNPGEAEEEEEYFELGALSPSKCKKQSPSNPGNSEPKEDNPGTKPLLGSIFKQS
ncbi:hypothetical protein ES705_46592 [subsurface metagenome]